MFCPNCSAQNDAAHHYCRICGLNLDAIVADIAAQRPSKEFTRLLERKRRFELLGIVSLSIAGIIGLSMLFGGAFYYKLQFFSFELLMRSASVALVVFAVLSIVLLFYPKLSGKFDRLEPRLPAEEPVKSEPVTTSKLLSDPRFEPASVTEHSTELLKTPK